jgi:hypothetical protein
LPQEVVRSGGGIVTPVAPLGCDDGRGEFAMTGDAAGAGAERYTVEATSGGSATLTATGAGPLAALAAALAGVLAFARGNGGGGEGVADGSKALPVRADGADGAELFARLAASLIDDLDHATDDVTSVRVDGLLRTDEGLTAWGYALSNPGPGAVRPVAVEDVGVDQNAGGVTIRATLRRVPAAG